MKKVLISSFLIVSLFILNIGVFAQEKTILLDDVNTINFYSKLKDFPLSNIKKICSYDYCDYVNINSKNINLSDFSQKYIASISDVETQKTLMVKGIKITKIILYD